MHNVEIIDIKSFSFKHISLKVQLFLIGALIVSFIVYFFVDKNIMMPIIYGLLSLIMFVMAYNNKEYFKRKYMTWVYLVLGFLLVISTVVEIIW